MYRLFRGYPFYSEDTTTVVYGYHVGYNLKGRNKVVSYRLMDSETSEVFDIPRNSISQETLVNDTEGNTIYSGDVVKIIARLNTSVNIPASQFTNRKNIKSESSFTSAPASSESSEESDLSTASDSSTVSIASTSNKNKESVNEIASTAEEKDTNATDKETENTAEDDFTVGAGNGDSTGIIGKLGIVLPIWNYGYILWSLSDNKFYPFTDYSYEIQGDIWVLNTDKYSKMFARARRYIQVNGKVFPCYTPLFDYSEPKFSIPWVMPVPCNISDSRVITATNIPPEIRELLATFYEGGIEQEYIYSPVAFVARNKLNSGFYEGDIVTNIQDKRYKGEIIYSIERGRYIVKLTPECIKANNFQQTEYELFYYDTVEMAMSIWKGITVGSSQNSTRDRVSPWRISEFKWMPGVQITSENMRISFGKSGSSKKYILQQCKKKFPAYTGQRKDDRLTNYFVDHDMMSQGMSAQEVISRPTSLNGNRQPTPTQRMITNSRMGYSSNGYYSPNGGYTSNGYYSPNGGYSQNGYYSPNGSYNTMGDRRVAGRDMYGKAYPQRKKKKYHTNRLLNRVSNTKVGRAAMKVGRVATGVVGVATDVVGGVVGVATDVVGAAVDAVGTAVEVTGDAIGAAKNIGSAVVDVVTDKTPGKTASRASNVSHVSNASNVSHVSRVSRGNNSKDQVQQHSTTSSSVTFSASARPTATTVSANAAATKNSEEQSDSDRSKISRATFADAAKSDKADKANKTSKTSVVDTSSSNNSNTSNVTTSEEKKSKDISSMNLLGA